MKGYAWWPFGRNERRVGIGAITTALALLVLVVGLMSPMAFAAKSTLRLAMYGAGKDWDVWKEVERLYEVSHPDTDLKVELYSFNDYPTKLVTLFATNSAPDVFITWAQYKANWAEKGMLLDLTPFWTKSKRIASKDFYPFVVDSVKYRGKIVGTPHDFNSEVWFINNQTFEDAGLSLPKEKWTIDDLRTYAEKTTNPKQNKFGAANPIAGGWGDHIQWTYNWTGHEWLDEDRNEVLIDDPKTIEMVDFWRKMAYEWQVTPSSLNPGKGPDYFRGDFAMWQGWLSYTFYFADLAKKKTTYDWSLATFPAAPFAQKNFAQGHMFSVPSGHKDPEKAWELAEWLADDEAMKLFAKTGRSQPQGHNAELWELYFSSVPADIRNKAMQFTLGTLYSKAYPRNQQFWVTFPEMNNVVAKYMSQIFDQQKPVANTLKLAAQEMRQILKKAPGK